MNELHEIRDRFLSLEEEIGMKLISVNKAHLLDIRCGWKNKYLWNSLQLEIKLKDNENYTAHDIYFSFERDKIKGRRKIKREFLLTIDGRDYKYDKFTNENEIYDTLDFLIQKIEECANKHIEFITSEVLV